MLHQYHKKINNIIGIVFILMLSVLFVPANAQSVATYDEAIARADNLYKQNKYLDAKSYYQMALKYKKGDAYAKEQITSIVDQMKKQMANEDEYYDVIDLADIFFDEQAYDKALQQYSKALKIIPKDDYARERIDEINRIKAVEKDKIAAYNRAMSEGNTLLIDNKYHEAISKFELAASYFPERSEPSDKLELAKRMQLENKEKLVVFDNEVEEAGRYLLIKNYAVALEHYEKAQALFPGNKQVNDKIAEIKPQAENQQEYNKQVELADNLYISKDFIGAKKQYELAGKTWPENSYPKDMISRIDDHLAEQRKNLEGNYRRSIVKADSLFELKEFEFSKAEYNLALNLKPNESYPKSQLRAIDSWFAEQQKAFEENYSDMIEKADSLFNSQQYTQAKDQFNFALTVKPDDEYPKQKLAEIDQQEALLAESKKLDATYQEIITEADNLYNEGHYDLAIKKYAEAQAVKSMEIYPTKQISAIRLLLADAEKQREIDENYGKLVLLAARLFNEGNLVESKNAYRNALDLKPSESMPVDKIQEIDSITDARIRQAEIDKIYRAHIKRGDSLLNLKDYNMAILAYTQAIEIKGGGQEADKKLLTARTMKRNYEKAISEQLAYDEAIREGNKYFDAKNYELAKLEYEKAVELKNKETYPKKRIVEINSILKRLEAEKEQRFTEAIVRADNLFEQANYSEAVIQYKIANSIKPEESHPTSRIAECNTLLAEQLRKIKGKYDLAIADADKLYASKIYDKAINAYKDAETTKPDETYPREMIVKITRFIEENAITDVVGQIVTVQNGVTEKFSFEPVPVNVRKSNYILVKARNLSSNSFKIIFNYGQGGARNGGFVVQVPTSEEYNDFIIRVGNQYKWFSADNDWFTAYPEGGDIEIKLIRISTTN